MASNYFQGFNYSLANEDFQIERGLSSDARSIAAVCGAGLRAFSLIRSDLDELTLFDIAQTQLDYAQFHLLSIRLLTYPDYLKFFGFLPCDLNDRIKIKSQLAKDIQGNSFLNEINLEMLENGLIYSGRWESFVIRIAKIVRFLLDYDFDTEFYQADPGASTWPKKKLKWLLKLIASPAVFNRFLYRGHMPTQLGQSLGELLIQGIDWIANSPKLKNSALHQLFFIGNLKYREGIDAVMSETQFNIIKKYKGKINFECIGLAPAFKKIRAEFWSCSDVLSYQSTNEVADLSSAISESSYHRVVIRTFRKHPLLTGPMADRRNLRLEEWASQTDLTRLYEFRIYDKR